MSYTHDLVLFPCSRSKHGTGPLLPKRTIDEFLDNETFAMLETRRRHAFAHPRVRCNRESELIPALARYSGWAYRVDRFKELVQRAVETGTHCLIVSAGYGLLRPEEPICDYDAKIEHTRSIWRDCLPRILSTYIAHNGIHRVFVACSRGYADVIHDGTPPDRTEIWCLPTLPAGSRTGPEAIGRAVVALIAARMIPGQAWWRGR
jgi:hypothetical protein